MSGGNGPSTREGGIERVGPGEGRGHDDVRVTRGTLLGNPFVMRGETEREAVVAAYANLLRTSESLEVIAKRHGVDGKRLSVDPKQSRVKPHHRLEALRRLGQRVRRGEALRVRCACACDERCHGDVIVEWVREFSARARPSTVPV
jgi:hypothetical protein